MDVLNTLTVKEFNSLCRFCTKKHKNLKPIFKEENDGGCFDFTNSCGDNGIVNMLNECTGLETTPTDGLPLFICTECYQKLLASHSFRTQCIESVDKLRKIRLTSNNVKREDDDSNDQNNTFFADTFADDDGWDHDQDDDENYADPKMDNCKVIVEAMPVNVKEQPKRKPTAKRKPPAKRKSKAAPRTRKGSEEPETVDDVKIDIDSIPLTESATEASVDDLKPELDPVTGEIVTPALAQENKPNRKRDRTKGPKVKKEKKPYVRKPNKPEQCDVCGFISRSLKSHMLVHTQERNFECDFCGKKFALRASLKNHIFAHINIRPFQCAQCPSSFKIKALLKKHMLTHTNKIKPFRCDQCPRAFYRPFDLNQHKLTHTKTRHHLCPHCDQSFGTSGGLKSHIGLHNGTRPFSCGLCEMTFVNSSSASTHRRSHQIGNVYRCQKCGLEIQHFTRFKMHAEVCQST